MKKNPNPKKPSDYRTLQIRVPPEKAEVMPALMETVEKVRAQKNKSKAPDEKYWMKNHVLLEAVEKGLEQMSKNR